MNPTLRGTLFVSLWLTGRTGGARMLERAIPAYGGLGLLGAIIFGPNGVDPRDVAAAMATSAAVRSGVWAAWLLVSAPIVGALLRDRQTDFLRALPTSRLYHFAAFVLWASAAQLPMVLVIGAGAGVGAATRAWLLGTIAAVLLASPSRRAHETVALAGIGVGLVTAASGWATLALAPAGLMACYAIWSRGPEFVSERHTKLWGTPAMVLGEAHVLRLLRVEKVALSRAVAWAVAGGALAALAARNRQSLAIAAYGEVIAFFAIPILLGASAIAKSLYESDRSLDVVLRAAGAARLTRAVALGLSSSAIGAVLAGLSLASAHLVLPLPAALWVSPLALGAVLSPWVVAFQWRSRPASSRPRDEGGRVLLRIVALGAATVALAILLAELAVVVLGALGLALAWLRLRPRRPQLPKPSPSEAAAALHVRAISKRFGGALVLRSIDLSIDDGAIALVRGENGSGKSTFLKIAAGMLDADEGEVWIHGVELDQSRRALESVGYAPDVNELPDHLSAGELMTVVATLKRAPAHAAGGELGDRLGVRPLLGKRLSALSLGQRRRVGLTAALVGNPTLLLLDEPTNGLDAHYLAVLEAILRERRERACAALLATHDAAVGDRLADKVYLMRNAHLENVR